MKKTFIICLLAALSTSPAIAENKDPLEGFNRGVWTFNRTLDKHLFKPVAQAYSDYLPTPVVAGVGNFFGNIRDIPGALNLLLQGRITDAVQTTGRVLLNTTVGIAGLFDVASDAGLEKQETDFGQTLARWGVGEGAYIVLPLLGPSTIRDTGGKIVDFSIDPVAQYSPINERNVAFGIRATNDRADLLPADKLVEEAALDEYVFVRDAWLQKRRNDTGTKKKYEEETDDDIHETQNNENVNINIQQVKKDEPEEIPIP